MPKAVRDQLGARAGDELTFEKTPRGFLVRHRPRISVLDFAGSANTAPDRIPATAEALDELIARGRTTRAGEDHLPVTTSDGRRARPKRL